MKAGRILIVGATGVLRPAVDTCLARGDTVVAVARDLGRLARLTQAAGPRVLPVSLDVFDAGAVGAALVAGPLSEGVQDAILYVAGTDDEAENAAVAALSAVVRCRTVRILNSRWTPPGAPDLRDGRWPVGPGRVHLLLGRQPGSGPAGGGWHTREQISAAAVEVLAAGRDAVLGEPVREHAPDR